MGNAASFFAGLALLALSPAPIEHRSVSLEMANTLAESTLASCRTMNRDAVVAIVDRSRNLVALQRRNQVRPHNPHAAERKALTALSTKTGTSALVERAASDPGSRNLAYIPELLLLGGGLPIVHAGEVIGGIDVVGSGGSASDEQCVSAAVATLAP